MIKLLRQLAMGFCAIVIALACTESLARAGITSLSVNREAVAVADSGHTAITVSGTVDCTFPQAVNIILTVLQGKSGSLGSGLTQSPIYCTGDVENYRIEVDLTPVSDYGVFQNGPASVLVNAAAIYSINSPGFKIVSGLVITGANNN